VLGMCSYWGGQLYSVFPRERDFTIVQKIAQSKKQGIVDKEFFDAYCKKFPEITPEVRWSANPGKAQAVIPYTNIRGAITYTPEWVVYQNEWQRSNFPDRQTERNITWGGLDGSVTPTASRCDFLLYYYREFLRHGFDGLYWDNIAIASNNNPVCGNGYHREDGSFQPSCDIWELREVTKRMAVLADEQGKVNVNMPHMTNAYLIPVFSWTGINLDWEWKYGATDFQDRVQPDYIRAASIGLQGGNVPVILSGIRETTSTEQTRWVERTRIAVCVPHELKIWEADNLYRKLTKMMYDLGYGTDACKVYRYWEEKPVVNIAGMKAIWLVLETKDTVLLFLCDYGEGGSGKITLDTTRLGLPRDFTAVNWENPKDTVHAANGVLEVKDIVKHDFRVWVIQKK